VTSVRLVQLTRIYGESLGDDAAAAARIAADPERLAQALFAEATANDDVISTESALGYLADRLGFFEGLVGAVEPAIRAAFAEGLRRWGDD
jgi:hypothetical protein